MQVLPFLYFILLFLGIIPRTIIADGSNKRGGEKAFLVPGDELPSGIGYRQDVCHRWDKFRNSTSNWALKDGLSGMQLNVAMAAYKDSFFHYSEETGIDPVYPGLAAVIMDELAKRAKFTWRNSFAIYKDASDYNTTWSELLVWAVDSFDLTVDWWLVTVDRMNDGVAFLKEWYDSSFILIGIQRTHDESHKKFKILNWMQPFTFDVWWMILATIFGSAIVHMLLEYFANDRDNRSLWTWFSENFYMSFLIFSLIYQYNPKSSAGRFFGMSMSIWALVMTATYTANLASLLVDHGPPPPGPQSLAEAVVLGHRICVWEGSVMDTFLLDNFGNVATRVPVKTNADVYHGLYSGKCDFSIDSVASWNKFKAIRDHNPQCKLYWVGGEGKLASKRSLSSFAAKADSGNLCSGFIRDVLNIHMHDIIEDGFLEMAWNRDYRITQTIDCDAYQDGETLDSDTTLLDGGGCSNGHHEGSGRRERRRLLGGQNLQPQQRDRKNQFQRLLQSRVLTNSDDTATTGGGGREPAEEAERLTLNQMLGIFIVHWTFCGIALIIAGKKWFLRRVVKVRAPSFARTPHGKEFSSRASMAPQHQQDASRRDDFEDIKEQLAALQQTMDMDMKEQLAALQRTMEMDIKEQLATLVRQQNQKMENMQQSKHKMQQQIQQQMREHGQKMKQYEDLLLRWPSTSSLFVEEEKK